VKYTNREEKWSGRRTAEDRGAGFKVLLGYQGEKE